MQGARGVRSRGGRRAAWAAGARPGRQARGLGAGRTALALGARPGRWVRGLGAWAGQDCALGAPDLIFKPVFDLVFFLSQ